MENRALGKGLSALIQEKSASPQNEAVIYVKVGDIRENSLQPRMNYDEAKLSELIASIKEKGVLQPILVRPKQEGYELIAGERRLRAARALNFEEVPVVIKAVDDQEALILALIENIQREELNPLEEAQAFQRLINEFHFTQDYVAQSIGKDRSTVGNLIRLLKLPEEIKKSIFEGNLSVGHARALVSLDNLQEQKKFFKRTIAQQLSVRELENLIKYGVKQEWRTRRTKTSPKASHLIELEDNLQKALGTKVRIIAKKKRGKIVIEFYSLEDLERISEIIRNR